MSRLESRQVQWWVVHQFVADALVQRAVTYDALPVAGTPEWRALDDNDFRKLLAVAVSGVHWTLRIDTEQELLADASSSVAEAADWGRVASQMRTREAFEAAHSWSKRVAG